MKLINLLLIIVLTGCASPQSNNIIQEKNEKFDSLESELLILKKEIFCTCFHKSLNQANGQIIPPDGSTYIQLAESNLISTYREGWMEILKKYLNKSYTSHDSQNKLYLMRCLDLYHSPDLELYIDSVRNIERNKILSNCSKEP